MRIAITGATGLVGSAISRRLVERGDEVVALTRDPGRAAARLPPGADAAPWAVGDVAAAARSLAGADAVVNLAGEPVLGRRWSRKVMAAIRESRVEGTRTVVGALRSLGSDGPRVLVSASAVGYYGPCGAEEVAESAAPGDDFLARLCVDWEAEAFRARDLGARVAAVRVGVVLSRDGGALPRMLPPFRFFVGGPIGNGRQGFPWIHIEDLVDLFLLALDREEVSGPLNGTAPHPVSNRAFGRALGRVLRRPCWLPVPGFALRLVVGRAATVLTKGQFAVPRAALDLGLPFAHPEARAALEDLLR